VDLVANMMVWMACFVMLGVLSLDLFVVNADATFVHY
jgi:hypothetical protein